MKKNILMFMVMVSSFCLSFGAADAEHSDNQVESTPRTIFSSATPEQKEQDNDEFTQLISKKDMPHLDPFISAEFIDSLQYDFLNSSNVLQGYTDKINCLKTLSRGRIALGSYDGTVYVLDPVNEKNNKTLVGHTDTINCLAQLPNGRIVSGSSHKLKIWDVYRGVCCYTFENQGTITCLFVLKNGKIVSGSSDNTIKIWDVNTGQCLQTLQSQVGSVMSIEVLPDGRLAYGSFDGIIKIWGISEEILQKNSHEILASLDAKMRMMKKVFSEEKCNAFKQRVIDYWYEKVASLPAGLQKDWLKVFVVIPDSLNEKYKSVEVNKNRIFGAITAAGIIGLWAMHRKSKKVKLIEKSL